MSDREKRTIVSHGGTPAPASRPPGVPQSAAGGPGERVTVVVPNEPPKGSRPEHESSDELPTVALQVARTDGQVGKARTAVATDMRAHESQKPTTFNGEDSEPGDSLAPGGDSLMLWSPDSLVGTTLSGRYVIEKKIGEGGMGTVFMARHNTLEKPVALKVMHGEYTRKPDLVQRFLQEAKAASRIRHENVIDITDFGVSPDGMVFFAMEYLEGHDLHDELVKAKRAGEKLPWARSRNVFLQTCAALEAAHQHGVIHRDLKPENIFLIDYQGQDFVKLLDFGIAKMTEVGEEERKLTRTGMLFGTPEYMSPEQARGEKPDHRVDVYAMGCILYQLVAGHVPFRADTFMAVLSKHLSEPPPVLGELLGQVGAPAAIDDVVAKALEKDRDQRYQSMTELAEAVLEVDADGAQSSVTSHPTGKARRKRTRWTGQVRLPEEGRASPTAMVQTDGRLPTAAAPSSGVGRFLAYGAVGAAAVAGGVALALMIGQQQPAENVAPAPSAVKTDSSGPAAGEAEPVQPAPAALPEKVLIEITSDPEGALVRDLHDGRKLMGETPAGFLVDGDRQPREFEVSLDGYETERVMLIPNQEKIVREVSLREKKPDRATPRRRPPRKSGGTKRKPKDSPPPDVVPGDPKLKGFDG